MNPPWLHILLNSTRDLGRVSWIADAYNVSDIQHIETSIASSEFDTLGLQRMLWNDVKTGGSVVEKYSCAYGSIILIYEKSFPWKFPFEIAGHVLKLFHNPEKPFRIVIFGNRTERLPPAIGEKIEKEHINGGYTYGCRPDTIVVYRREEVIRVLIHECLHGSCSDPTGTTTARLEADTEAWAEVVLCAVVARGSAQGFRSLFTNQYGYSLRQCKKLVEYHNVKSEEDYAWRYTIGKLEVWRRLGLEEFQPRVRMDTRPLRSLKLTNTL